jgi:hypothetical protein
MSKDRDELNQSKFKKKDLYERIEKLKLDVA